MHWYPREGNSQNGLSAHAQGVMGRLADGTFEIDFERLADILIERLGDEIPDCERSVQCRAVKPIAVKPIAVQHRSVKPMD